MITGTAASSFKAKSNGGSSSFVVTCLGPILGPVPMIHVSAVLWLLTSSATLMLKCYGRQSWMGVLPMPLG